MVLSAKLIQSPEHELLPKEEYKKQIMKYQSCCCSSKSKQEQQVKASNNRRNPQRPTMTNTILSARKTKLSSSTNFLFITAVLLAFQSPVLVRAQFCTEVEGNTWRGFVSAIRDSFGFAALCPFEISGERCYDDNIPNNEGYVVESHENLFVFCDTFFGRSDERAACVIDCPNRHFTVRNGGFLTMDRLTLRGSSDSSVLVEANGGLRVINSRFERNINSFGRGGAIRSFAETFLEIEYSEFNNNAAINGGAVYNMGGAVVAESLFMDNSAATGGAYYSIDSRSRGIFRNNMFVNNKASGYGPAIYNRFNTELSQQNNVACGNQIETSHALCDGIQVRVGRRYSRCTPFGAECVAPTASPSPLPTLSPTISPTATPSLLPSGSPSALPSSIPSDTPSLLPSYVPSIAPSSYPSLLPSDGPSLMPSFAPSLVPSDEPSLMPSAAPSSYPSLLPSDGPSLMPSFAYSANPSQISSDIAGASLFPSDAPSLMPSFTPSSLPSDGPSLMPSWSPTTPPSSTVPSSNPSEVILSDFPSLEPSRAASDWPTVQPTSNEKGPQTGRQPSGHTGRQPTETIRYTVDPLDQVKEQKVSYSEDLSTPSNDSSTPSELPSSTPSSMPVYFEQPDDASIKSNSSLRGRRKLTMH